MAGFLMPRVPRNQITLWSECLDDAIAEDHFVRLFNGLCEDEPFLSVFEELDAAQEKTEGRPGYAPSGLAKLLTYGQMIGVRSSRQLEEACRTRLDVIWLMQGLKPDHATIARLISRHGEKVKDLLKASIEYSVKCGVATLEMVAIDGTFIEANAGRGSVCKKDKIEERIKALDGKIEQLMNEYQQNDQAEGMAADADMLGTPNGAESMPARRAAFERKRKRLEEAVATIERREAEPRRDGQRAPNPIASTTDPDARHLRDKEGRRKPNYNVQLGVDATSGIVVAATVTDEPNDSGQMMSVLEETKSNCGAMPKEVVVDAGYHSGRQVAAAMELESEGSEKVTVFMSDPDRKPYRQAEEARAILKAGGRLSLEQLKVLPRDGRGCFHHACFVFDGSNETYRCPAGEILRKQRKRSGQDRFGSFDGAEYGTTACGACELAEQCHRSKTGRRLYQSEFDQARHRMLDRTKTAAGKERAILRGSTVEPRIGELKTIQGLRRFLRRGLRGVKAELEIALVAMNVKRLIKKQRKSRIREPAMI